MTGTSEKPPVDDLRNVFIPKRGAKDYEASDAGDEYGLIVASSMLSGIFPVVRAEYVTPRLRRITITGDALARLRGGWQPGLDVRALFPPGGKVEALGPAGPLVVPRGVKPLVRTYTVRSFDDDSLELALDFVIHEHPGSGSSWARQAEPGDLLALAMRYREASPRDHGADWLLLAGDDTAVPVIGSIIETLPPGARAVAFLEVDDEADEQVFATEGDVSLTWFHRRGAAPGTTTLLEDAVKGLDWLPGRVFAWATGEVRMATAVRRYVREERGLTRKDYKIQAYWRRGMTEPERLAKVKENIAALVAQGVDPVAIYNERGMSAEDPSLTSSSG